MTNSELNERIIAAGITRSNDDRVTGLNRNDLIIGGSSAGKTTGYVCPNIFNPTGSFVVSDTKGRLYSQYKNSLKAKGYNVVLLDLVNPGNSCGYNPISYIRRKKDGTPYEPDVKKIATLIVPQLDNKDPFWQQSAARYISMLIGYVIEALPKAESNINSVLKLHRSYLSGEGINLFREWAAENPGTYTARKFKMLGGLETAEKTYRCVLEFANESLDPFDCEEFQQIFGTHRSFDIHKLEKEKTALFINSSDHDRSYHVLGSIINSQILQTLIDDADKNENGKLKIPVNLFLDDFAAAARIPDLEMTISIIRSRNISLSIILQSLSQLTHMYGQPVATTIINNCDTILFLGGGHDLETAQFIANHANMTPTSVLSIPRDKAILITSGEKSKIVDKIKPTDAVTGLYKVKEEDSPESGD